MDRLPLDLPEAIESARLRLRAYQRGDGAAYLDVCRRNRQHLLPYEKGNPALDVQTLEEAEALVRRFAAEWAARANFFWGGWDKASGAFVCQVTVVPVNWDLPEFEVGYFVDTAFEGQGYVTEAVQAVVEVCFVHLHAVRLRLSCNELNVRSWRVAERCGFVREGYVRRVHKDLLRADGVPSGDYHYGLLRSATEAWQVRPQP